MTAEFLVGVMLDLNLKVHLGNAGIFAVSVSEA
jgi:hypothetical protein